MKTLNLLEEKVTKLLGLISSLKTENTVLKKEHDSMEVENAQLSKEKVQLEETVSSLSAQLEGVEGALLRNDKNLEDLNTQKTITKSLVDDLIKNIDSLMESEKQQ